MINEKLRSIGDLSARFDVVQNLLIRKKVLELMVFTEIGLNRRFSIKAREKGGKITIKDRVSGKEEGLVGW